MLTIKVSVKKREYVVSSIPKTHNLVLKSYYSRMKEKLKQLDGIVKRIESKYYQDNALGCCLMGTSIGAIPQESHEYIQDVTPLMNVALCSNAGIPVNSLKVAKSTLSMNTI